VEGGNTGVFEIICRDCGDHPGMDYIEVIPPAATTPRALPAERGRYGVRATPRTNRLRQLQDSSPGCADPKISRSWGTGKVDGDARISSHAIPTAACS